MAIGASYFSLTGIQKQQFVHLFQTGWFVESLWTQTMVVYMLRTQKVPFLESLPATPLLVITAFGMLIGLITLSFILLNYRGLLFVCFNEELGKLRGIRVKALNYALIALASANIVLSIKAVGLVLSASFISIPAMTSLMVSSSFLQSLLFSAGFSFFSLFFGIALSLFFDLPPRGAVVVCMVLIFLIVSFGKLTRKRFSKAS